MEIKKVIISGGGSGGHIFPAIAIANELKFKHPNVEILFVGAIGKMEMEKVPASGYAIVGLPIAGFQRKFSFSNFTLPFKLIVSLLKAVLIVNKFKPEIVVGVGGYASGPMLRIASLLGVPTLVQEQNSFPGKTNRILSKVVKKICVAYDGLEKFFPKDKIVFTGNPVRNQMIEINGKQDESITFFGLDSTKKTILVIGGSQGARTLNNSVIEQLDLIVKNNVQVVWQCGKFYAQELMKNKAEFSSKGIFIHEFIQRMDLAYAAADVIISRAGAMSVSELCLIGKPSILIPSPNVSDDHQTINANALVEKNAAVLIRDVNSVKETIPKAIEILNDSEMQEKLSVEIKKLGIVNAAERIVNEIEKVISQTK
jgi:UDP-N-acetylglucosamine--N-acetylmuramyl-(pentapeptide) pyrophosphoryl-undecaprenol N-acetylglucosamine transferase